MLSKTTGLDSYAANFPCEDREALIGFEEVRGGAIFDGHGGWKISDFLSRYIHPTLLKHYSSYRNEATVSQRLTKTLEASFDELETMVTQKLKPPYQVAPDELAYSGSCGIVALVIDDTLVVANTGDSQAVLVSTEKNGSVTSENLCAIHNTTTEEEIADLNERFSGDESILVPNQLGNTLYVKGRLMCTRTFGDLGLKHEEFNLGTNKFAKIQDFKGPYITHKPDVAIRKLTEEMQYLVLGSDGLWDELAPQQIGEIVMSAGNAESAAKQLTEMALNIAAERHSLHAEQLKSIPVGRRRAFHDDITVLVIPLR